MEQQAIRIETLGDLVAHGYGMNAMCEKCRHRADLDMAALIARFGEGFIYVGRTLDGRLVCSQCGAHDRYTRLTPTAPGSRIERWIRSRPKPKVKAGTAPLSDDRFDKFVAAMSWYVGRHKGDPEFARSPHYYAAVSEWFGRLSLDDQERVHTTIYVYSTPGYGGEKAAITYAALLPAVPAPPELVRKAWARLVHWN
jgi:hypothetical protein